MLISINNNRKFYSLPCISIFTRPGQRKVRMKEPLDFFSPVLVKNNGHVKNCYVTKLCKLDQLRVCDKRNSIFALNFSEH